jgi:hypothetical protein
MNERAYYVTIRHDGAPAPVWRSAWCSQEDALILADRKREECRRIGSTAKVEVFHRDGGRVKEAQ